MNGRSWAVPAMAVLCAGLLAMGQSMPRFGTQSA